MGWFSWITGGTETANKVVDGVVDGFDMVFFTPEEKSIASQKILDWKLAYAKASSGQNIARRVIAIGVSGLWALLIVIAVIAKAFEQDAFCDFIFNMMKENVNTPFSIVLGFYFLAHVARGFSKN